MRVWFWTKMCDWTSRLYLVCCKRLWVCATGTPVPEGTLHASASVVRLVDRNAANDNGDAPDAVVRRIMDKFNN